jgi:hypothetical protein
VRGFAVLQRNRRKLAAELAQRRMRLVPKNEPLQRGAICLAEPAEAYRLTPSHGDNRWRPKFNNMSACTSQKATMRNVDKAKKVAAYTAAKAGR